MTITETKLCIEGVDGSGVKILKTEKKGVAVSLIVFRLVDDERWVYLEFKNGDQAASACSAAESIEPKERTLGRTIAFLERQPGFSGNGGQTKNPWFCQTNNTHT